MAIGLNFDEFLKNIPDYADEIELEINELKEIFKSQESLDSKIMSLKNFWNNKKYISNTEIMKIINELDDNEKIFIVEEDLFDLNSNQKSEILSLLDLKNLASFYNSKKDFLKKNNIELYNITSCMDDKKQVEFCTNDDLNLDLDETQIKKILVTFNIVTKWKLNSIFEKENVPAEIQEWLNLKYFKNYPKLPNIDVIIDEDNLDRYSGLDELFVINGFDTKKEDIIKFGKICPNLMIISDLSASAYSTLDEYIEGEEWIDSILSEIDETWSDIQKIAYIDNRIGKKISFSPDIETEYFNDNDCRALWKIISSGYGVCNGIANVEKYILDRIGIESEIQSTILHAFLKLKNVEIPTSNGIIKGNTFLDPTWNLSAQRYGYIPNEFCKSYEEIRKSDIDINGCDHFSHEIYSNKHEETINLEKKYLKEIYSSIGLADKNGKFPIDFFAIKSKEIDDLDISNQEKIQRKLELLSKEYPDFAECQFSTISMLQGMLKKQEEYQVFERCIIDRVYEKADPTRKAVVYIYTELLDGQKDFYYADAKSKSFIKMDLEKFEEKFDCYEIDKEKYDGKRRWECSKGKIVYENLSQSSGKISLNTNDKKEGCER